MRRFALAICIALGVLAVPVTAAAKSPTMLRYTQNPPALTLSGVCAFDITIHATVQTTEFDYFDGSGTLTRIYFHATEQDTFTGPGRSLTTIPYTYTYNFELRFDSSGEFTAVVVSGVVLQLRLP